MVRISIFIDNSNIFKGFKKYNIKADYEKLKNEITRSRELHGIYLYEGVVHPIKPGKKKWYNDLKLISGYTVKTSFDKQMDNGVIEKKVDLQMAIDIISLAYEDKYDTAVIVTGDGDFEPVIEKLKEMDKKVELWAFRYSLANTLKEKIEEDKMNFLDDVLSQLKI